MLNRELTQGVYLANAIIPKIGNQHVKLLNVTDATIIIDNMKVETVPLSNYQICSVNKNVDKGRYTDERFRKLLENLNLGD